MQPSGSALHDKPRPLRCTCCRSPCLLGRSPDILSDLHSLSKAMYQNPNTPVRLGFWGAPTGCADVLHAAQHPCSSMLLHTHRSPTCSTVRMLPLDALKIRS